MTSIRDLVLEKFGDDGAKTVERYLAQFEYTAFWCIRMLRSLEQIETVIPEGVEDVVVIRCGINELHQVKTRDESAGPWTIAEVLPVLCQQYHKRNAFPSACHFHFVSNQMADNRRSGRRSGFGQLYVLKHCLDILHSGQSLSLGESAELSALEGVVVPEIQKRMATEFGENLDFDTVAELLHHTWIETDSPTLRAPRNVEEFGVALADFLGNAPYTLVELQDIYDRLLLLVIRRVLTTSLMSRRVHRDDVVSCTAKPSPRLAGYPSLDDVPGVTLLDKKAYLGGFDPTEVPHFHRQRILATATARKLETLGLSEAVTRLSMALVDQQSNCRHLICRENGLVDHVGPRILAVLRGKTRCLAEVYLPGSADADDQFCLGLVWRETNECRAWWHSLDCREESTS